MPKSLMLNTPGTLELVLRWPILCSTGEDERPDMAESTLVRSVGLSSIADILDFVRLVGDERA